MRILVNFKIILKNDRNAFHKDPRVNKIVDSLLNENTSLFEEIVNVINNIFHFNEFEDYIPSLIALYDRSESNDKLGNYITFLWYIYKDDTNCGNLRGALLERLVYKLLEKKYVTDYESYISCYICFNSWKSSRSIDVFFYVTTEEIGESIECKVNPFDFEKAHIDNLKEIFIRSNKKVYPSIISFSSKNTLELKMQEFKTPLWPIQLFGRENLKEIAEIRLRNSS